MKKNYILIIFLALFLWSTISSSQTFTGGTGAIPDNSCTVAANQFTASVSGIGTIGDTHRIGEVIVNIDHTYVGDLELLFFAPNIGLGGISLSSNNGGNGANYTDTHFTPNASTSITSGTAPFTGNYLPQGDFSFFDGFVADGDWTLQVCDSAAQDTGTLLSWSITFVPVNDDLDDFELLTVGQNFDTNSVIGTNAGATHTDVPGNPTGCGSGGLANIADGDVWYSVLVPSSGNITIETKAFAGSSVNDLVMAIYENSPTALYGCDDDSGDGLFPKIELTGITPGTQFYIRVWEFNNDSFGKFTISAYETSPPGNDEPTSPVALLVGLDFETNPVVGTNLYATASEINDPNIPAPNCASYLGGDVWYTAQVPATGQITIETGIHNTPSDTGLAIYNSSGILLGCDDDGGESAFSKLELTNLVPGEDLQIRVWEFGNETAIEFKISAYDSTGLTYVPDDNFETYLETHDAAGNVVAIGATNSMGNGIDDDDYVLTSRIETVTVLNVEDLSISDLKGIEGFNTLIDLNCSRNDIVSLDMSQNTALKHLNCFQNVVLSNLNISANLVLETLSCGDNALSELNVANLIALTSLECRSNMISQLNVQNSTTLTELYCNNNDLSDLNVNFNIDLEILICSTNSLSTLNISNNAQLNTLSCDYNNLTTLDVSTNPALTILECTNNNITTLELSENTALTSLRCNDNALTYLNLANGNNSSMVELFIYDNPNLTCVTVDNQTIANDWNAGINTPLYFDEDPQTTFNGPGVCAPINDLPTGATSLTVGGNFEQFAVTDSNANATASEATDATIPATTCGSYAGADLWYAIEIPEDGSVIIETGEDNSEFDTVLQLYSGTPDNLTALICHDDIDDPNNRYSQAILIGATPGDIVYARVWNWGSTISGTFNISAYRNPAISTYVPDDNFEAYLETHDASGNVVAVGDPNSMGNGVANDNYVTTANINTVTFLDVFSSSIADLTGIEGFSALQSLDAGSNSLTTIDLSQNTALILLDVSGNQLTSLDVSQNLNLIELFCGGNQLTSLDVSQNTNLQTLNCSSNQLSSLNVSTNTQLLFLLCEDNQLTSLDVSENTQLHFLVCNGNQLTSLDVSENNQLANLDCGSNQLSSLNIANGNNINFSYLIVFSNQNLTCVTVDDQTIADDWNAGNNLPESGFVKDPQTQFSVDCDVTIIEAKAYLQGALSSTINGTTTLMRDDLRTGGHLPTTSPYPDGQIIDASVFNDGGMSSTGLPNDNIVDWVFVELRDADDASQVIAGYSALLQRDGDIVDLDGISPLLFLNPSKYYYVVVKHRNHLGIMSNEKQPFPKNRIQNYVDGTTATFGTTAQVQFESGLNALWTGDTNTDRAIQFSGGNSDVNIIKDFIVSHPSNPFGFLTQTINGYKNEDINMNGEVKFSGPNNDSNDIKDIILSHPGNILNVQTFTITSQVPENQ